MTDRQVQSVAPYSYDRTSTNPYANPEYLRLMMTQMSVANIGSVFGSSDNNSYDPFSGTSATSGTSNTFYSDLMRSMGPSSMTPQMEISIYGNLIDKTIMATHNNKPVNGKVESVFLSNNKVMIKVNALNYYADQLIISKIE